MSKAKASKSALPNVEHMRKRKLRNDPHGMENAKTRHLRAAIFGRDAGNRHAGANGSAKLTREAAQGLLYHSVTNVGLDVERYNAGYDSDQDAEGDTSWRLQLADEQLAEMVDMLPIEKYFFALWNQFVTKEFPAKDDRRTYPAWKAFVKKYGGEVRRMRMEAILHRNLVLCWELGIMDADGVYDVVRTLRERCMDDVQKGRPHPQFDMARRLLRETREPVQYSYNVAPSTRRRCRIVGDEAMHRWVGEQREKMKEMGRVFDDAPKGWDHPHGPWYLRRSMHALLGRSSDPQAMLADSDSAAITRMNVNGAGAANGGYRH